MNDDFAAVGHHHHHHYQHEQAQVHARDSAPKPPTTQGLQQLSGGSIDDVELDEEMNEFAVDESHHAQGGVEIIINSEGL